MAAFIQCNDLVVHHMFRRGAGGPAIVFVNSLGTDLRIWDAVVDLIPADIPVLRYDKRGHGLSAAGPISIEILADDLAALMDKLSMTNALVCGVSVGGLIAQQLATTRPDLVSGLVLSNTSYQIGNPTSWAERIVALESGGLEPLADGIMERWFSQAFRENETEALAGYRAMLTRTPLRAYIDTCAAIRDADLSEALRGIAVPSLCIAGGKDLATPPGSVRALANRISEAEYKCFDGVGHLPCIEDPQTIVHAIMNMHGQLT